MESCSRPAGIRVHDALETVNTIDRNMHLDCVGNQPSPKPTITTARTGSKAVNRLQCKAALTQQEQLMSPLGKSHLKIAALVIVLPLALLVVGTFAFVNHIFHPVTAFCKGVKEFDTSQGIIERAKSKGLFYTRWQGIDDLWIMNKPLEAAPHFRIACVIKFKDGKVTSKETIDAD
jgi:hypothetical protein